VQLLQVKRQWRVVLQAEEGLRVVLVPHLLKKYLQVNSQLKVAKNKPLTAEKKAAVTAEKKAAVTAEKKAAVTAEKKAAVTAEKKAENNLELTPHFFVFLYLKKYDF
jgi:hypothetical protein